MRVNAFHRMGGHLPRQAKTTIVVPACPITQDKNRLFPPKRAIRILTYTACLSVTVDNYSHTSEHLFEFVQRHAGEYRSSTQPMKSTAQRHSIEPTTQRAAAARYGHGPNAWNQESPSDRRARSKSREAPPPRPKPQERSYSPAAAYADPGPETGHSYDRTLLQAAPKIPVHAYPTVCHHPPDRKTRTAKRRCGSTTQEDVPAPHLPHD